MSQLPPFSPNLTNFMPNFLATQRQKDILCNQKIIVNRKQGKFQKDAKVMVVIRTSDKKIRWMNITDYLETHGPGTKQIEFDGEPFTTESPRRFQKKIEG
jgi:hypothetical protein